MSIGRHIWFWLAALVGVVLVIALVKEILLPFVVGIVLAYFLNPVADRLSGLGVNRTAASALIVGIVAALVVTALYLIAPVLFAQAQHMANVLPGELERLANLFESWARERLGARYPDVQQSLEKSSQAMAENVSGVVSWLATSLWDRSLAIFNFLTLLLVTPVVMFYVLVDWHPMIKKIDGWLPREHAGTLRKLAGDVNAAVAAFIRGQGTVCLILGTFYALALSLIGAELRAARRRDDRCFDVCTICRLGDRIDYSNDIGRAAILAGYYADPFGCWCLCSRTGVGCRISLAENRWIKSRPASRLADFFIVRIQLSLWPCRYVNRCAVGCRDWCIGAVLSGCLSQQRVLSWTNPFT